MKALFDQLNEHEAMLNAVAVMCNTTATQAGFRNTLRDTPALPDDFTMGEAARAYLRTLAAAMVPAPVLIRICDLDDPQYDVYALAPVGMEKTTASEVVGHIIRTIKAAQPTEYLGSELREQLIRAGFSIPNVTDATETW